MSFSPDTLFKFLEEKGYCWISLAKWHLPYGRSHGKWMPAVSELEPCYRGYHLSRKQDLILWLAPCLFEVEFAGDSISAPYTVVVGQARLKSRVDTWNVRTARLFAADCAERVLHFYQSCFPGDDRPASAIEAARAFASDDIELVDMQAAALSAGLASREAFIGGARSSARALAWGAARAAVWSASKGEAWFAARRSSQFGAACVAFESISNRTTLDPSMSFNWVSGLSHVNPDLGPVESDGDPERQWQTECLWSYINETEDD